MHSEKPLAPRPVKRNSNNLGIKLESGFERRISIKSNSSQERLTADDSVSPNRFSPFSSKTNDPDAFYFAFELENNISEECAKSELFSILNKNDSTFASDSFNSGNFRSGEEEPLRISLPPIRTRNPVYKNACIIIDQDQELNLFKFKSEKILRSKISLDD
jgi:hypothetical protein